MYIAADEGHAEVVRALVEVGVDMNRAETMEGRTPLYIAAHQGHIEVVRALVEGWM